MRAIKVVVVVLKVTRWTLYRIIIAMIILKLREYVPIA